MVFIEELSLKGIRSYNPEKAQVITFDSPLTLIVGQNGTGKTTLIEALKYITTNDLPINSKGGAFVYYPKLAKKSEVTARISLKFTSTTNKTMEIVRSIQASQKNTKSTFKTLESNIYLHYNGSKESVANKSTTLEADLQNYMGVSSALLENVIFCHQEEANWILSEPAIVKKKLDDIFATTKYAKALDNIKTVKREINENLKLKNNEIEALAEKKFRKEKIQDYITKYQETIENIIRDLEEIERGNPEGEIYRIKNILKEEEVKEKEIEKLKLQINYYTEMNIKIEKNIRIEEINDFIENIKDKEKYIINSENYINKYNLGGEYNNLITDQEKKLQNSNSMSQIQCAYDFDFEAYLEDQKKELNCIKNKEMSLIKQNQKFLDKKSNLYEDKLRIESLLRTKVELENKITKTKNMFAEILSDEPDYKTYLEKIQKNIDVIQSNIVEDKTLKKHIENNISKIENESYTGKLKIENCTKKLFDYEEEMKTLNSILCDNNLEMEEKLNEQKYIIRDLLKNAENEYLNAVQSREKYFENKQKLDNKNKMSSNLENLFAKLYQNLARNKIFIEKNFENGLSKLNFDHEIFYEFITNYKNNNCLFSFNYELLLDKLVIFDEILEDLFLNRAIEENEIKKIHDKIIHELDELNRYEKISFVNDLMIQDEWEHTELTKNINSLEKTHSMTDCAKILYTNFMVKGSERNLCYLCKRSFDFGGSEKYVNDINDVLKNLNVKLDHTKNELEVLKNQNSDLLLVREKTTKINELKRNTVGYIKELIKYNRKNFEHINLIFEGNSQEKIKIDEIFITPKNCNNENSNINDSIRLVNDIISSLSIYNEIEIDDKYLNAIDLTELANSINTYKNDIEELDKKLRQVQINKVKNLSYGSKENITERIIKIDEEKIILKNEIESIQEMVKQMKDESSLLLDKLNDVNQSIEFKTNDLQKHQKEYMLRSTRFTNWNDDLLRYEKELQNKNIILKQHISAFERNAKFNVERQYDLSFLDANDSIIMEENLTVMYNDFLSQYEEFRNELQECLKVKEKIEKAFAIQEERVKNINSFRDLQQNNVKIEKLNNDLRNIITKDLQELRSNLKTLEDKRIFLNAKKNMLKGRREEIEYILQKCKQDILDYNNIETKYAECYVELKAMELINSDIDMCFKALDNSIVEYYSTKIEEINIILKELWVNTYKGNDIDYIQLKSEAGENKSYNYRMVMIKNGTELDLRGRCSAGQKVLTSILVRLALSDAFCASCSILALDEPTTNLDKENVEALAITLRTIIEKRKKNENFQLICITHDIRFVEIMCMDNCEYYYQVYKDESGNSQIEKISNY